ncbi:MAG: aminotransferase class V-fold PLP-dependent enzyme [Verrucomicrobia bacterium]|nr:aminotransferase class V-fold PLP-dependent enzyme [Verrucomicrobiota bacterium]NDF16510.1 aminotransferase class V-fold PLP-dependent enzyme [Verrucomicrobiota bacterium]
MAGQRIFLDQASGGPVLPSARAAMEKVLSGHGAAPGGGHREARESLEVLRQARNLVADFLGVKDAERIVFTSGGTESVQSAIRGWGEAAVRGTVYVSEMEHPAVEASVRRLQKEGFLLRRIPVDGEGRLQWMKVKPGSGPGLVCVHLAHHDVGTVQDLREAVGFANSAKAQLFLDATFGAGWVPLPKGLEGIDLLAISGHRLGGPKGSGLLFVRSGFPWKAQTEGGRQENDQRAGTENLPAIAGLGAALEDWLRNGGNFRKTAGEAQRALLEGIRRKVPTAKLHGPEPGPERNPAHLGMSFAGLEAEALALVLDRVGVAVKGGSGCVTREMQIPPAMKATGAAPEESRALILLTLSPESGASAVTPVPDRVSEAVERLRSALSE